ncbi:hypothetical protein BU25DRAFT_461334 [Macroventuria anomochaeta]|uniref:Uncharacterized protein n=1 Tax=Macroventuria anomochaeta TaxID=301207 RepID=A0ACB6RQ19_9PLEO|nr:uncharacterized protein BU25DRAFT_461334 [Macroventuria anomochaeta]KAF2624141.1 hypothetical protein BU25DRAFT_461334 [Macroventuria anomochaeta]
MKDLNMKTGDAVDAVTVASVPQKESFDEKFSVDEVARQLNATAEEVLVARDHPWRLTLEETRRAVDTLVFEHTLDPNFPERLKAFQTHEEMATNPEGYEREISRVKVGISLLTTNSPYAEMCVVDGPQDEVNLPVSTIHSWVIGFLFVVFVAFINQLFSVR